MIDEETPALITAPAKLPNPGSILIRLPAIDLPMEGRMVSRATHPASFSSWLRFQTVRILLISPICIGVIMAASENGTGDTLAVAAAATAIFV